MIGGLQMKKSILDQMQMPIITIAGNWRLA